MATSGSPCVIGEKAAETGCHQTGSLCEHVSQAGGAARPQGSLPSAEQEVHGGQVLGLQGRPAPRVFAHDPKMGAGICDPKEARARVAGGSA